MTNFISESQKNEEAWKILMKANMEQMESEEMKMMMEKNTEIMKKIKNMNSNNMMKVAKPMEGVKHLSYY